MRIGLVLMTPKSFGGAETALQRTALGYADLGIDFDVIAATGRAGKDWSSQCSKFITRSVRNHYGDIEAVLAEYDGLVLSDTYFGSGGPMVEVLTKSDRIPKWTSARHWNSTGKTVYERHEIVKASPQWCGRYVYFWPSAAAAFPEIDWVKSTLPYTLNPALHALPPLSERSYHFLHAGRTDPQKGVVAFVSALEQLSRSDDRIWFARIAGVPGEMPGGPHIAKIADMLENWGWEIQRAIPKGASRWMKSNWRAVKNGSIIDHTGGFGPDDLAGILGDAKVYSNNTSAKYAPEHLEFMTMEALDAGCMVIAPDDWPHYQYPDEDRPVVTPTPEKGYRIIKGARTIYNDFSADAPSTTYAPLAEAFKRALDFLDQDAEAIDAVQERVVTRNRTVLAKHHNPTRAAKAYLEALNLEGI